MKVTQNNFKCIIPIKENWSPPFRTEYDGKYITLHGLDKNDVRKCPFSGENYLEEHVLIPVLLEIRDATPSITKVDNHYIYIDLKD